MNLLSFLVFSPLLGMLILIFIPKTEGKLIKLVGILATLPALVISMFLYFQHGSGTDLKKWDVSYNWFSFKNSIQYGDLYSVLYELGIDGLSLVLLLLTTIIATLAAIASVKVSKELKGYYLLFLLLEIGMLGVFAAQNFILFFLFFEFTLIAAFFLIGKWGYEEKEKAAFSFLIYNGLGSAILLIVIIVLFAQTGTVNFGELREMIAVDGISPSLQFGLFISLLVAFGFKMPIVPLHSWMVRVHVQAPPAVVMIHAGVLLKIGAYGLIRFNVGLFPEQAKNFAVLLAILGVINLLYGAFLAFAQTDFKMVLAYSSVSHMGIVLIGLGALNEAGIQGAIFQSISHGLIAALLFFLVGVFYERTNTSEIPKLGGMAKAMPLTAGFLLVGVMASLGLPGLSGFVSEFMAFLGLFREMPWLAAIGAIGIIMTAVYLLRAVLGVTYGRENREWAGVWDLQRIEWIPTLVLTALIIAIGVYPNLLGSPLQATLESIMLKVGG
ncbi:NADH-quinone oxidoreductase subunit M [Niallia sp. XMNu-256]|uniref:complex I subunit 4 family protein n=1 Tax=Niallia sp. XMNu-256 TaxID=3082444 RepID=UPI0030D2DAA1